MNAKKCKEIRRQLFQVYREKPNIIPPSQMGARRKFYQKIKRTFDRAKLSIGSFRREIRQAVGIE